MSPFFLSGMGAAVFLAMLISIVSLLLHWARSREHPDVSQCRAEITRLETSMQELRTQHLDLIDKVEHWVRRDRVRRLRASKETEPEAAPNPQPESLEALKAKLRRQAYADAG